MSEFQTRNLLRIKLTLSFVARSNKKLTNSAIMLYVSYFHFSDCLFNFFSRSCLDFRMIFYTCAIENHMINCTTQLINPTREPLLLIFFVLFFCGQALFLEKLTFRFLLLASVYILSYRCFSCLSK